MPQRETRYLRLGQQITRLVLRLVEEKDWNKTQAMNYLSQTTYYGTDMIHRWRQGKTRPLPEVIEILAQIGKKEAHLPREWGESLLRAGQHPDASEIVNALWGPKEMRSIPCNLPALERPYLIGRRKEIQRLLELLSPEYGTHLITVDGIGGVGKTTLVLEVAHRCWRASQDVTHHSVVPTFEAIVFVSAKQQYLTSDGILISGEAKRTLHRMFREIALTLSTEITHASSKEQPSLVRAVLGRQRTLLIVDNMETMEDKQEIISYLYELPSSVKVIITTRERFTFSPIRLEQLSQEEALDLIEREAQEKSVQIQREQALHLYQRIGGIPVALIYAIGQMASGFSLETILAKIPRSDSEVAKFCFEGSIHPLRGKKAHALLMAMALFPRAPLRRAVIFVAGLLGDPDAAEEGLAQLQKLSLIQFHEGRYTMLPLTREYALSELVAHISFEREACQRWVDWYRDFTKEHGGKDWGEWSTHYDLIDKEWENLLAVFDWCAAHGQYQVLQVMWQKHYLVKFAQIYGYWDDRLIWLEWLIQAAVKQGDWSNAVRAMVDRGSTLTLIGQWEEAEEQLKQAWHIHRQANPWEQIILAAKLANLCIYQRQYSKALQWLDQAQDLLNAAHFDKLEYIRRLADLQMYRGNAHYRQGDYNQGRYYYQEVLHLSQEISWHRMVILAAINLANIATAQGHLDEAETFLKMNFPIVENNTDKRQTALYRQALAQLSKAQGKRNEAYHWGREALNGFERLGMKMEAEEMQELLRSL